MWDDGAVMVAVDFSLVVTACLSALFVALYVALTQFERSVMGRLIAANAVAWLLCCVGGILYRAGEPAAAGWFFLPLAVGVPLVLVWWIALMLHARRDGPRTRALVAEWTRDAWDLHAAGRSGEALQAFKHARQLARLQGGPAPNLDPREPA